VETLTLAQPLPPERGTRPRTLYRNPGVAPERAQRSLCNPVGHCHSKELGQLEDFLLRASKVLPVGELFVYSVKIDGRQHYRVALRVVREPAEALGAIKGLPPQLSAYHRTIEAWKECAARIASSCRRETRGAVVLWFVKSACLRGTVILVREILPGWQVGAGIGGDLATHSLACSVLVLARAPTRRFSSRTRTFAPGAGAFGDRACSHTNLHDPAQAQAYAATRDLQRGGQWSQGFRSCCSSRPRRPS